MSEPNAQSSKLLNIDTFVENERKRKRVTMDNSCQSKQLKNNYYSILVEDDFQCDESLLSKYEKHVQVHSQVQLHRKTNETNKSLNDTQEDSRSSTYSPASTSKNSAQSGNKQNVNIEQSKKEKVPPINIYNVEPNELISFIKNGLKINDFQIKDLNHKNKKITLHLKSMANFSRVKIHLQKTHTNFYTFTPKCIKNKTILLKGLSGTTATELILDELRTFENQNLKFVKVAPFYTNRSKKEKYCLSSFLVQLSPESDTNELKNIKGILHHCIKWEPLKKPEIQQCRNCQGFFHSAANCFLPPRCVKCKLSHETGKCAIDTVDENERDKLYCVVCNKYGHPASYKGCEKYRELQKKVRSRRIILKQNANISPSNINPNISYANTLKSDNPIIHNNNTTNIPNNFFVDLKNTLTNLSNQMINLQNQLQLQSARIDTLFSFMEVQ